MEAPQVTAVVIVLICVDLGCTLVNTLCEETNVVNPTHKEHWAYVTHYICVRVLIVFLIEQILHLVAFGAKFFTKFWFVCDLFVVCVSLVCETVLEDKAEDWLALLIILRLWKVVSFCFDLFLCKNEDSERDEKIYQPRHEGARDNMSHVLGKMSNHPKQKTKPDALQRLGRFMESPLVASVVIMLIFVDLFGTLVNSICEDSDFVNPIYDEQKERVAQWSHTICVSVLSVFLVEQCLHLVAFGLNFFTRFWFVMDLVVVCISLLCETVFEKQAEDWLALFIGIRLWKVAAFIFDTCLADNESTERDEKVYKKMPA